MVLKATTAEEVAELRATFPVHPAPDEAFGTESAERDPPYVIARGPTDGNNGMGGLQMTWRLKCNDLTQLEGPQGCREMLRSFWRMSPEPRY